MNYKVLQLNPITQAILQHHQVNRAHIRVYEYVRKFAFDKQRQEVETEVDVPRLRDGVTNLQERRGSFGARCSRAAGTHIAECFPERVFCVEAKGHRTGSVTNLPFHAHR